MSTSTSTSPPPPTTKTVVVTEQQPLIPNEDNTVFCLTRRNIFDTIIAALLVGGIIYFVIQWRKGPAPFTGLSGMFSSAASSFRGERPSGLGENVNKVGQQMAGALKRLFH